MRADMVVPSVETPCRPAQSNALASAWTATVLGTSVLCWQCSRPVGAPLKAVASTRPSRASTARTERRGRVLRLAHTPAVASMDSSTDGRSGRIVEFGQDDLWGLTEPHHSCNILSKRRDISMKTDRSGWGSG
jgi:hypothetical protein